MDAMKAYKLHAEDIFGNIWQFEKSYADADAAYVNNIKAIKYIVLFAY